MGWYKKSLKALIRTLDGEIEKSARACESLKDMPQAQKKYQHSKEMLEYWIEARQRIADPQQERLI